MLRHRQARRVAGLDQNNVAPTLANLLSSLPSQRLGRPAPRKQRGGMPFTRGPQLRGLQ